ncbi:unnamed protein product [Mytilus edulis]|uniref:Uncharacterized protein n=1 Tax=Mytilus edulis TaxID=6550 RepID=A0A8S3QZ05_MYTED|nr:unnamed protein product [Mytilus edulis]
MLKQYKDHIKELLISLLAIMLTKLSTSQINEAFYLCNAIRPCVSTTTIQIELARAFLDISLNPNISQHRKSIIEDKIQQLLIFRLTHKRMINICIKIVKTKGDIEVHPGPSLNKKALAHDSTLERRWIQNISPKILILLPEHEQSKYKPTKKKQSDANSSQVSYDFPFSDECVPLKTMATIVHQTTIHKPSSDSYQKVTAEKYLTDSPKQDACLADNQINLIIIPPEALRVLNTYFPCNIYPDSQAILKMTLAST